MWVGRVTAAASHFTLDDGRVARDSVPGPLHPRAATIARRVRTALAPRPPELGGHLARKRGAASVCVECRGTSCAHAAFAAKRCKGSAVQAWAERACRDAGCGATDGGGHSRRLTGGILWCNACGAYAELRAVGLGEPCKGRPRDGAAAWRRNRMRAGLHPASGRALAGPLLIEPRSFVVSSADGVVGAAAGLDPPRGAVAAAPRRVALLARVRAREAAAAAAGVAAPSGTGGAARV